MKYALISVVILLAATIGCSKDAVTSNDKSPENSATPAALIGAAAKSVAAGEAILLDVREQGEWDEKHFTNSILLPMSKLNADDAILESTEGLDKAKTIYTHCAKGKRASTVADALKEKGYKVEALKFSFEELAENGFEVSK